MEQTQVVTKAGEMDLVTGDRLHCLELSIGNEVESRHVVGPLGVKIGRTAPADIILADSEISRAHCMVVLKDDELYVSDLNSTNGTYVDGTRIAEPTLLPFGSILQVGKRAFKHEWRSRVEIAQSDEFDRELKRAESYVKALLPPPLTAGAIRADWIYEPSTKLGGDAFGYGRLSDDQFVFYLVDVAGHGAGAAMHAVAIMNQLRQHSLPNTDMAQPELVLSTLNELFQMEDHAGLYFTIWYGVYNSRTRRLDYASGGHHAAYLVSADRSDVAALRTRNVMIGAMPAMNFRQDNIIIPPGSSIYMFSDGVYEIVDKQDKAWEIDDFVGIMLEPRCDEESEPRRLYNIVRSANKASAMEDDFSLVVLQFD